MSQRPGYATQRSKVNDSEESKEQRIQVPKFSFWTDMNEFCWDPDNSSKEIQFS